MPTKKQSVSVPYNVAEIVRLHEEIMESMRTNLIKAIRIGELLTIEKRRLGHGKFLPWIAANLPFTDRTARNYMRVFENRDQLEKARIQGLGQAYDLLLESKNKEIEQGRAGKSETVSDLAPQESICSIIGTVERMVPFVPSKNRTRRVQRFLEKEDFVLMHRSTTADSEVVADHNAAAASYKDRLAVNYNDLRRVPLEFLVELLLGRLDWSEIIIGSEKSGALASVLDEAAVVFKCDLLSAAKCCDILRADDRACGDPPTRAYVQHGSSWITVTGYRQLTMLEDGKIVLNPEVFRVKN